MIAPLAHANLLITGKVRTVEVGGGERESVKEG